ncbi:hypothetical protein BKA56DRAFT_616667 [Ilyonectria sp. MPI-CAGE-AT-0026]|nr:hypothetical protein BKA56DRAFT_616667 [Ilyonectria sp. MPI-CAGE-AT-0026]
MDTPGGLVPTVSHEPLLELHFQRSTVPPGVTEIVCPRVYVPEDVRPGDNVTVLQIFFSNAYIFDSKDLRFNPLGLLDLGGHNSNSYSSRIITGWVSMPGLDMGANVGNSAISAVPLPQKGTITPLPVVQLRSISASDILLESANCTTLGCLRSVLEDTIRRANDELINKMPSDTGGEVFGPTPGFGPVPDAKSIPDLPTILFQQGHYHRELAPQLIPNAADETVAQMQALYDCKSNLAKLAWDWTVDVIFGCNA